MSNPFYNHGKDMVAFGKALMNLNTNVHQLAVLANKCGFKLSFRTEPSQPNNKEAGKTKTNSDYTAALIEIFCWLNGEGGEFPTRKTGEGAYWWRSEMVKRLNAAKARHCA
jgi:hypothetical protein